VLRCVLRHGLTQFDIERDRYHLYRSCNAARERPQRDAHRDLSGRLDKVRLRDHHCSRQRYDYRINLSAKQHHFKPRRHCSIHCDGHQRRDEPGSHLDPSLHSKWRPRTVPVCDSMRLSFAHHDGKRGGHDLHGSRHAVRGRAGSGAHGDLGSQYCCVGASVHFRGRNQSFRHAKQCLSTGRRDSTIYSYREQ